MTKTFLYLWVFSLPFALTHDNYSLIQVLPIVFLITAGFVGLESVSMELSDCFNDDPNDFDSSGHAAVCYEDIYMAIYKVDGEEWAMQLRDRFLASCGILAG
jgi:predicted membrane chloride channel (bestrophin family)